MTNLDQIRTALSERRGLKHSSPVRLRVGRYVLAQRRAGVKWAALTEALSVPEITLRRWSQVAESSPRLVQLVGECLPEAPATPAQVCAVTLVAPNGWRVEGVPLEQAVAVLSRA